MYHGGFQIHLVRNKDKGVVLKVSGEVDLAVVEDLLDAFQKCVGARYVVLDTSEVSFLDLTGLETIIQGSQIVDEGRFRLVPGKATERLLDLTGTREHFQLETVHCDHRRDRPQDTGLADELSSRSSANRRTVCRWSSRIGLPQRWPRRPWCL